MTLHFFRDPEELRQWLEANHDADDELMVGLYKKASGRPSITWPQLVDELLCFGWIDGVRRSVDDISYSIRITPRRPTSIWSDKNTQRVQELIESGRMTPAGMAAFERRDPDRAGVYSFENETPELGETYEAELRA
ncbi:MAG: bacteriocin-protection protein, partial [Gemmatimonadota bacterium]